MIFVGPLSFRKSDARVSKLIQRGHATDAELFEAQFGEWPVRGVNVDTPPDGQVEFKGFLNKTNALSIPFTMAYIDPKAPDNAIHLNRFILNPAAPVLGLLASRMIFPRIHTLFESLVGIEFARLGIGFMAASLLSSYRYALISSFTKAWAPSIADIVGEEHIHLKQFKGNSDMTSRRVFLNDADNIVSNRTGLSKFFNDAAQLFDAALTMMPRKHFAQDHELQARLHNLMVRGYRRWGRLPENEVELFAALQDMGIRRPKIVTYMLRHEYYEGVRKEFSKHNQSGYVASPAAEMNIGLNVHRSSEVLYRFWRDYLPLLYADLLANKYGDSKGFEKMGYSAELDMMGLPKRTRPSPIDFGKNTPI